MIFMEKGKEMPAGTKPLHRFFPAGMVIDDISVSDACIQLSRTPVCSSKWVMSRVMAVVLVLVFL